jgi:hypothetical protein
LDCAEASGQLKSESDLDYDSLLPR